MTGTANLIIHKKEATELKFLSRSGGNFLLLYFCFTVALVKNSPHAV